MRRWFLAALCASACDSYSPRSEGAPPSVTGIHVDASTGAAETTGEPRLDLGEQDPWSTGGSSGGSSSGDESTGLPTTSGSTGESSSGEDGSTGAEDPSTTGGESMGGSSTGEPAPVCGDGACDPAETEGGCYDGPGWCFQDCWQAPVCESDCPCTPAAAAIKNFCTADPPPDCPATAPGGFCDPNADGVQADADTVRGFYSWAAKCGG